jgi:hypothetical protein
MPTVTLTLVIVCEVATLIVLVTPVVLLSGIASAGVAEEVITALPPTGQVLVVAETWAELADSQVPFDDRTT